MERRNRDEDIGYGTSGLNSDNRDDNDNGNDNDEDIVYGTSGLCSDNQDEYHFHSS